MKTYHYHIKAMDCAEEVAQIKRVLLPLLEGDEARLRFDLLQGKLSVDAEDLGLSQEEIAAKIRTTGLETLPWSQAMDTVSQQDFGPSRMLGPREVFCLISGVGLLLGYAYHALQTG